MVQPCRPGHDKGEDGDREGHNHFVNNFRGTEVTPEMVLAQAEKNKKIDRHGHLYGAIIAAVRDYLKKRETGKYAEYHMAFWAHYTMSVISLRRSIISNIPSLTSGATKTSTGL
jgi:hypothetical protein